MNDKCWLEDLETLLSGKVQPLENINAMVSLKDHDNTTNEIKFLASC